MRSNEAKGDGTLYSTETAARRAFAALAVLHVLLLTVGYFSLAPAFGFPDILRVPAIERLARFHERQAEISIAYYLMTLSGLTQIMLAVTAHRALSDRDTTLALGALVGGILAGAWQAMGFLRWVIVVPFLSDAARQPMNEEAVALMEGLLNRYAGMAIGEHLGFIGQGAWTLLFSLAAATSRLIPTGLAAIGVVFGALFFVSSLEQLGGPFAWFGQATTPLTAAWFAWLLALAASFLMMRPGRPTRFGALGWIAFALLLAALLSLTVLGDAIS